MSAGEASVRPAAIRRFGPMVVLCPLLCVSASVAAAQAPDRNIAIKGEVSTTGLLLPHQPQGDATREFRSRARLEVSADPSAWLRLKFEGTADGLVADRQGRVQDLVLAARDVWAEVRGTRAELRLGYGRLIWGRLDEVMPSDVLNPIETSRYFLEGRAEARLPIAFARGRAFLTDATTLEGVVSLPGRRGRFDDLDEPSSPFNLTRDLAVIAARSGQVRRVEPAATMDNLQTGARLSSTLGRMDISVSAYRGFESFGTVSLEAAVPSDVTLSIVGALVERYSTFTMLAADGEAVVGPWAIRAEAAYFPRRQQSGEAGTLDGRSVDAGIGVDRAAGDYRLFTSVVWHRDWSVDGLVAANHDLSVIASVERKFSRDRYLVRVFGVGNPIDESGFLRGLASWTVRDNVALEASAGLLFGSASGTDTLSRFRDRDFGFVRLRWFF